MLAENLGYRVRYGTKSGLSGEVVQERGQRPGDEQGVVQPENVGSIPKKDGEVTTIETFIAPSLMGMQAEGCGLLPDIMKG